MPSSKLWPLSLLPAESHQQTLQTGGGCIGDMGDSAASHCAHCLFELLEVIRRRQGKFEVPSVRLGRVAAAARIQEPTCKAVSKFLFHGCSHTVSANTFITSTQSSSVLQPEDVRQSPKWTLVYRNPYCKDSQKGILENRSTVSCIIIYHSNVLEYTLLYYDILYYTPPKSPKSEKFS